MKLYYYETANPRKACAVAALLEIDTQYVRIDLDKLENRSPDYLAVNPNGKVPTLVDGDLVLWESDAIMCHLARKAGSELFPVDSRSIEVLNWLLWNSGQFSRYAGVFYAEYAIKRRYGLGPPDEQAVESARRPFRRFARVLEAHLSGRDHVVGNALTVADLALAAILPDAAESRLPLEEFPQIRRWHDGLMQIPQWADPFPASGQ